MPSLHETEKLVVFHDIASEGNPSIETRKLWLEIQDEISHRDGPGQARIDEFCYDDRRHGIGVVWL